MNESTPQASDSGPGNPRSFEAPDTPFVKAVIGTNEPERKEAPRSRLDYLYDRRNWLTRRARRAQARLTVAVVAGAVALVVAIVGLASNSDVVAITGGSLVAIAVCVGLLLAQRVRNLNGDLELALKEISVLESAKDESNTDLAKAEAALQVNRLHLKAYNDQVRGQGKVIFWVGVGCIAVGFGIIIAGFPYVTSDRDVDDKIVVAALSAVGGVIANFIAVIYLRMFSETLKAVGQFHSRMVGTHNLYFADYLATKSGAGQSQTFGTMAESLTEIEAKAAVAAATEGNGKAAPAAPAKKA